MQNATRQGAIRIKHGNNIIVENCKFLVTGHGGVFIENSSACIIRNNNITTASGIQNNQTDGIFSQRNNNVTFDNNTIIINNEHPEQHCDGIQSYMDMNLTVSNNYVEQRNKKSSNAQGIYATTMLGRHTYYNNVVYCPNTRARIMPVSYTHLDVYKRQVLRISLTIFRTSGRVFSASSGVKYFVPVIT